MLKDLNVVKACVCVCLCLCLCLCVYICVYIYIHTHIERGMFYKITLQLANFGQPVDEWFLDLLVCVFHVFVVFLP